MTSDHAGLSRRNLLAGAGLSAAAATAGVIVSPGVARADSGASRVGNNRPHARAAGPQPHIAFPSATAFTNINYAAFHNYDGDSVIVDNGSGYYSTSFLISGVDLPQGALVTELDVWGGTGVSVSLNYAPNGTYTWVTLASVTAPFGVGVVMGSNVPSAFAPVDNANNSYLVDAQTGPTSSLLSVRIGYVPLSSGFVPIAPARVYDSRLAGGGGSLGAGAHRTVTVANKIDSSGAIVAANVVPAGAVAVSANLTVVGVSASGFLAVTPGGSTGYTTSSINWSTKAALANAQDMTLGGDRQLTIFTSGAGTADFVIDVAGYYI